MARKRTLHIAESLSELRDLARRHAGRPQETRLRFLTFLKENPSCSIAEGALAAGISERQGRYLWDDYRSGGLKKVLERRTWGKGKQALPFLSPLPPTQDEERVAGMSARDLIGFMNAVAGLGGVNDPYKWARSLGDILMEFISDVDHAVVHVIHNPDPKRKEKNVALFRHILPDGRLEHTVNSMINGRPECYYELLIKHGKQQGFLFDHYHFPPTGYDIFVDSTPAQSPNACVGSIILFRCADSLPFKSETLDFIEGLRPFLSFVFMEFIARFLAAKPGADLFVEAIDRVAGNMGLTHREQDILFLLLLGNTQEEIAALLNISPATVRKHTGSIYRKAGVGRLSEFFARYFTPRDYFPEKGKKERDEG